MTFTIITVAWNVAQDLRETLTSVFGQTCSDFECIVQDGGSTDGTVEVARSFLPDDRLRIFSAPDEGIYDAMNRATAFSKGTWVIYLNAGDRFYDENVLYRVKAKLSALPPGIAYGNIEGCYVGYTVMHKPASLDLLWLRKPYHHQAMFIAGEIARSTPFDLSYRIVADHERGSRLFKAGVPFNYLDEPVASVDMRGGVSKDHYVKTTLESMRVFRQHFFRWDRELRHWLHLGKLVLVKNMPSGILARMRKFKNQEK